MNSNPKPIKRVSAKKYRGAGDVVAAIAKPIAAVVDSIAGTKLKSCSGCEARRKKMNKIIPFNLP